jgi:nitroreductase
MKLLARLETPGPKRMLSLDGGGVRGIYTLQYLARVEALLRASTGQATLCLADWFDFIGGTSTGAIIAAALALGFDVATIEGFYLDSAAAMFRPSAWWRWPWHRYDARPLEARLREVYGAGTTLGSGRLRTLLLITLHNLTTDSPWVLTNHPRAPYNARQRADCNLDLPLWQIVRAATAAPTLFAVQSLQFGARRFDFEDGALTPFNNPAFQMVLQSTVACYGVGWRAGAEDLFLMSIGTGGGAAPRARRGWLGRHLLQIAGDAPRALIGGAQRQQDLLCRVFGECRHGLPIDSEVGDLSGAPAPGGAKLFRYVRYNTPLAAGELARCGIAPTLARQLQRIDGTPHLDALRALGRAAAQTQVDAAHWAGY